MSTRVNHDRGMFIDGRLVVNRQRLIYPRFCTCINICIGLRVCVCVCVPGEISIHINKSRRWSTDSKALLTSRCTRAAATTASAAVVGLAGWLAGSAMLSRCKPTANSQRTKTKLTTQLSLVRCQSVANPQGKHEQQVKPPHSTDRCPPSIGRQRQESGNPPRR